MTFDPSLRIRRFHRAVTRETGALDQSFLGRGRPLGPARVLNAIGSGIADVDRIREYLGVEKTVLSRFLAGLQKEGLVILTPAVHDGRRRIATLTDAGSTEFSAYETLSNTQARNLLASHPKPEKILAAMDLIASALGQNEVEIIVVDPDDPRVGPCLEAFYTELGKRLKHGFDITLAALPDAEDMRPPRGRFLLAVSDGLPLGCVGIKGTDKDYGEIKRLWVSQAARGMGLARRLMTASEIHAQQLGVTRLRLDTNVVLSEALNLYQKTGWSEIERYNDDPHPTHFFEKQLC